MRAAFCLCALFVLFSCRPTVYAPKPRGYAQIDTPQHAYQVFDKPGFPYSFEYPTYGEIVQDSVMSGLRPDNPYWVTIQFPKVGGTFYLSYKKIDAEHPLDRLLSDAHEMSYFHTKRADYINAPVFHNSQGVHGVIYQVGGNAASAYQFFATDSVQHFLRGSMYFDVTPNADSLKPLIDFLHTDMERLIGTLRWK
jgi:gliding motility-associated lipoprotein GldD